jgi:hypothetical protein
MPTDYNIMGLTAETVHSDASLDEVFSSNGGGNNGPNIYRRNGVCWVRFSVGGQQTRTTLRTRNIAEARSRADVIIRRAHRKHFGMVKTDPGEWVYFMHDLDAKMVKVGVSSSLDSRFRSLKANTPNEIALLGSVPGSPELEKVMHQFFAPFHHRREWFRATPEVLAFVGALIALAGKLP